MAARTSAGQGLQVGAARSSIEGWALSIRTWRAAGGAWYGSASHLRLLRQYNDGEGPHSRTESTDQRDAKAAGDSGGDAEGHARCWNERSVIAGCQSMSGKAVSRHDCDLPRGHIDLTKTAISLASVSFPWPFLVHRRRPDAPGSPLAMASCLGRAEGEGR